jgi:hypothetical protein
MDLLFLALLLITKAESMKITYPCIYNANKYICAYLQFIYIYVYIYMYIYICIYIYVYIYIYNANKYICAYLQFIYIYIYIYVYVYIYIYIYIYICVCVYYACIYQLTDHIHFSTISERPSNFH